LTCYPTVHLLAFVSIWVEQRGIPHPEPSVREEKCDNLIRRRSTNPIFIRKGDCHYGGPVIHLGSTVGDLVGLGEKMSEKGTGMQRQVLL